LSLGLKILVYGYGNPGRQDDGLGNAFANKLEEMVKERDIDGFSFDSNYQLNIEDAEAVAAHDIVIFADASEEAIEDFCVSMVEGSENASFTTHSASPGYVVHLCHKLFEKRPVVYLVHMKGYEWEFQEGITDKARENLTAAVRFFEPFIQNTNQLKDPQELNTKFCQEIKT
jgi:hydrogenase maturation protease